jgi:hypothetical protein
MFKSKRVELAARYYLSQSEGACSYESDQPAGMRYPKDRLLKGSAQKECEVGGDCQAGSEYDLNEMTVMCESGPDASPLGQCEIVVCPLDCILCPRQSSIYNVVVKS